MLSYWRAAFAIAFIIALVSSAPCRAQATETPEAPTQVVPAPPETTEAPPAAAKPSKWYRGSLSAGVDALWGHGGEDIDLEQDLRLQIDPPQYPRLHLRGSLWLIEDLGATPYWRNTLRDLDDASDADVLARLSYLYVDIDDVWGKSTLRIGRQRIMEGLAFNRIDGVYFKQQLRIMDWYAFAGTRATFYEDDFEDWAFGGGFSVNPMPLTKVAVDAYYGIDRMGHDDENLWFHGPLAALLYYLDDRDYDDEVHDASVAVSVWQVVNEYLSLFGRVNWVDDGGTELLLSGTGYVPEPWDLTYELIYRHQFNSITDRVNDLTGYYRVLGTYESYDDFYAAVHRPIWPKTTLSLEGELHDSHNDDWSNRDYGRVALFASGEELFERMKLDARVGIERWSVTDDEGLWSVFGEVGRKWKDVRATFGYDFQRYEDEIIEYNQPLLLADMARIWFAPGALQGYNPLLFFFDHYAVEMHENIHTVYLKADWSISDCQELNAKLTFEEDDSPDSPTWRVQANYTIRF